MITSLQKSFKLKLSICRRLMFTFSIFNRSILLSFVILEYISSYYHFFLSFFTMQTQTTAASTTTKPPHTGPQPPTCLCIDAGHSKTPTSTARERRVPPLFLLSCRVVVEDVEASDGAIRQLPVPLQQLLLEEALHRGRFDVLKKLMSHLPYRSALLDCVSRNDALSVVDVFMDCVREHRLDRMRRIVLDDFDGGEHSRSEGINSPILTYISRDANRWSRLGGSWYYSLF